VPRPGAVLDGEAEREVDLQALFAEGSGQQLLDAVHPVDDRVAVHVLLLGGADQALAGFQIAEEGGPVLGGGRVVLGEGAERLLDVPPDAFQVCGDRGRQADGVPVGDVVGGGRGFDDACGVERLQVRAPESVGT
jgi:hypothetical protein